MDKPRSCCGPAAWPKYRRGSFSAEHGIGKYKLEELLRFRTATELDIMRALKRTLDPRGIMNPGKILQ